MRAERLLDVPRAPVLGVQLDRLEIENVICGPEKTSETIQSQYSVISPGAITGVHGMGSMTGPKEAQGRGKDGANTKTGKMTHLR